jgi:GT2 family glycosyltransferase
VEEANWMISLGQALMDLKSQNVRMVSARSDNPGSDVHAALTGRKGTKTANVILESGHLPLYCAMCHRELFDHIGGMIKAYPVGGYEDEELAFRMRKKGFKQAVCGGSWVHHDGAATFRDLYKNDMEGYSKLMEENRQRCLDDMKKLK